MAAPTIHRQNPEEIFELLRKVGEGSYGTVWEARNKKTGEICAVKKVALEDDEYDDIIREVEILKACQHENILAYLGSWYAKGPQELWIVTEFCGVGAISDLMSMTQQCLSEYDAAFVIQETLKGLAYLHSSRTIHRDIKANNILVNKRGDVKLADFGVSAQLTSTISKRQTMIGTPYWMAPEVIKESQYSFSADIWSVGITAIELVEGRPPLSDLHPMRAMFQIPRLPPPTVASPEMFSDDFKDFLQCCLKIDQDQRMTAPQLLKHKWVRTHKGREEIVGLIDLYHENQHMGTESLKFGSISAPAEDTIARSVDQASLNEDYSTVQSGYSDMDGYQDMGTMVQTGTTNFTSGTTNFTSGTMMHNGGYDFSDDSTIVAGQAPAYDGGFCSDTCVPTKAAPAPGSASSCPTFIRDIDEKEEATNQRKRDRDSKRKEESARESTRETGKTSSIRDLVTGFSLEDLTSNLSDIESEISRLTAQRTLYEIAINNKKKAMLE